MPVALLDPPAPLVRRDRSSRVPRRGGCGGVAGRDAARPTPARGSGGTDGRGLPAHRHAQPRHHRDPEGAATGGLRRLQRPGPVPRARGAPDRRHRLVRRLPVRDVAVGAGRAGGRPSRPCSTGAQFTGNPNYRYEQIAALGPDLIVGLYTGMDDAAVRAPCRGIAPTVGPPAGYPEFGAAVAGVHAARRAGARRARPRRAADRRRRRQVAAARGRRTRSSSGAARWWPSGSNRGSPSSARPATSVRSW